MRHKPVSPSAWSAGQLPGVGSGRWAVGRAVRLASGQRALVILTVSLALGFSLAAESRQITKEQVEEITSNLVCLCGCGNKTVSVCGCGVADATIKEVRGMLNEGKTAEQIFAHYVDSTGIAVLASPPKKGFDLLAWVLPFAGILIAGVFLVGKIRDWQKDLEKKEAARDKAQLEPNQSTPADPYRKRLAKELEKIA